MTKALKISPYPWRWDEDGFLVNADGGMLLDGPNELEGQELSLVEAAPALYAALSSFLTAWSDEDGDAAIRAERFAILALKCAREELAEPFRTELEKFVAEFFAARGKAEG